MGLPKPYYDEGGNVIYHGDCREILPELPPESGDLVLTDPPYGIGYRSGHKGRLPREIAGDQTTALRDWLLEFWLPRPLACFATWKCRPPIQPRGCLVWHKAAGGMGDLTFPWAPTFELIWVYGKGWSGHRGDSVLTGQTVVSWNSGPVCRRHPHEKPVGVISQIIVKHSARRVLDPFAGSGPTVEAARDCGRSAVGIEIEERYCEIAAKRLAQGVFKFTDP